MLCGLLGATISSVILDKTHAYRTVLKSGFVLCCVAITFISSMLYSNNFALLCLGFGFLGLFFLPMVPAVLVNCAETTFPIPEELSVGLLFIGGNLIGIPFVIILQVLIDAPNWGPPPFYPSNFFAIALVVFATGMLSLYNGQYKRLECERNKSISVKPVSDNYEDISSPLLVTVDAEP